MKEKIMLLVDDVDVSREALAECFCGDFSILHADDGRKAIRLIEEYAHQITIILLDVAMPGMNGLEVLKWLKNSEYSTIPVISVAAQPDYQLEALENGAWDFIAMPADNRVICARVNNVLRRYAPENKCRYGQQIHKTRIEMDHLINSIPGGIATYKLTDSGFETLYFSDGVAALTGHTREEYVRRVQGDASSIIYKEDRRRLVSAAIKTLKSGQPIDETYRICHKDGSLIWVRLNGVLIGEEDGMPLIHAVFQRPPRMASLYDNLVNESQNIIYVSDINNHDLLYINHTGLQVLGKKNADYSGRKCYEFLFDGISPCPFCKVDQMCTEHYLERDFAYAKNGRTYSMRGKLTNWNGLPAHVEYLQDVTETRRAERRNAALTQQLQSVMENVPGGMCVYRIDENGVVPVVHNQAFFALFGYSDAHRQAVLAHTNYLNVHPEDLQELQDRVNAAVRADERINHTYRVFNDTQNRYIWMNLNGVVVPQDDGSKLLYVNYSDVTAEREVQEKLIRTQQVLDDMRQKAQDALDNYQLLVNTVPGGIAQYEVRDGQLLTRFFSDGLCELTGYPRETREQMRSQDVLSVTYEEDTELVGAAIRNAVAKHENLSITYRMNTQSGEPRWVHLNAAYSPGPQGECLYQAVFTDVDKLKKIERELQENQIRYEVAVKSSGINIWEYDIEKDSLYVVSNSSRIKQNCFHIENYIQSTLQNGFVREDSIDRFLSTFTRLRQGEREITEDIWYKTTDEAGWWCERVTYTAAFDDAQKPLKAFGAGRDVTREKEAEKKFREEMSYRKAIQSDNLASVMVDLTDNRVLEINSTFSSISNLVGGTADHYFTQTAKAIIGEEFRTQYIRTYNIRNLLNRFSSGEYVVFMELTRLYDTNRVYWVNYSAHLIQNPETKHVVAHISCIDITQEKVMQTIMETIIKSDYDALVVVDGTLDSALDYGVKAEAHLYDEHKSFERQIEVQIRNCVCAEDVGRLIVECKIENIWAQIKDGQTYKFSFGMRMPDGEVRRKQLQFTAINSPRKTFLMSRIDVHNIYEEQQAAKENLRQALQAAEQASHAKTVFLSRMSHDIRTPMNAVISLAALGQDSESIAEARDYLKKIGTSGQYLLAIINDVLDLSKMDNHRAELHPEAVCLPDFIRDTLAIVMPTAREKQIDLQFRQIGITDQYMKLDTTYVRQVAVNLLSNAIKFTPGGGSVELILENISRESGFVKSRMTVRDTGIGISPEFLPRIFSPFEQENAQDDATRQGTGLGLSIVKSIVDQMGGRIWVESERGHGSAFYVEWLLETATAEEAQDIRREGDPLSLSVLAGKHILLAEDHPLNAEIAKKLLSRQEMIIDTAANGQAAVDCFREMNPGHYDAILMDIRMPVMNGLEAARAIRALERPDARTIPIIAMTANAFDSDVRDSLGAGMDAHLTKPIEPQRLYETLAGLMVGRREQSGKIPDPNDKEVIPDGQYHG